MSETKEPKKENKNKNENTFTWADRQLTSLGFKYRITQHPRFINLYTILLSLMVILDWLTGLIEYFDIALLLSILFLVLSLAEVRAQSKEKRKEEKKQVEKTN